MAGNKYPTNTEIVDGSLYCPTEKVCGCNKVRRLDDVYHHISKLPWRKFEKVVTDGVVTGRIYKKPIYCSNCGYNWQKHSELQGLPEYIVTIPEKHFIIISPGLNPNSAYEL